MKTQSPFAYLLTSIGLYLILGVSLVSADEPLRLGYERLSNDPVDSGTAFELKPQEIYGTYADQWTLVGTPAPSCGYRLIDIEPDHHGTKFNVVWIKNEGDYKTTRSYFLHDLTAAEVDAVASIKEFSILDIESYGAWWQPRKYAVIVKANPLGHQTKVLKGVTYSELQTWLAKTDWRPIDIDMHQTDGEIVKMPRRYEESMNYYDAVFTFAPPLFNRVDTWVAYGDHQDILDIQDEYHVIDVENTGDWYQHYYPDRKFLYIFVDKGNSTRHLDFLGYLPEQGMPFSFPVEAKRFSRCIDVEDGSDGGVMAVFKE